MDPLALAALFIASTINAAIPGPCILLIIGRSARGGLRAGLWVVTGVLFSALVLVTVAILTLLGLLTISLGALTAMKWIGVAILLWLAAGMIRARPPASADHPARSLADVGDLVSGAMVGFSSPINLVFLLALLPQFVPATGLAPDAALLLGGAYLAGGLVAETAAALFGAASLRLTGGNSRWIELGGAAALFGFAGMALLAPLD